MMVLPGGQISPPSDPLLSMASRATGSQMRIVVPFPGCRVDPELPAPLLDQAVHGRQPEARSVTPFLGGEERLQASLEHVRIHAGTVVGHRQESQRPGRQVEEPTVVGGGYVHLDRYVDASRAVHGVARVDDQIDDDLLHLAGV